MQRVGGIACIFGDLRVIAVSAVIRLQCICDVECINSYAGVRYILCNFSGIYITCIGICQSPFRDAKVFGNIALKSIRARATERWRNRGDIRQPTVRAADERKRGKNAKASDFTTPPPM